MQRLLNKPENYVDEMLEGIYLAHPNKVKCVNGDLKSYVRTQRIKGKVALATGGGSGHLPIFLGYVGEGLLDGASVGGVFQAPGADRMFSITKEIDTGAGVLYIFGNYSGDKMNFEMAKEMAELEGIKVRQVISGDDCVSAPKGMEGKRRGVAGLFFVYKCAGGAADDMLSLDEVERIANKAAANVRSMGMALAPCTIPEVGKPNFEIMPGEMELGIGIHGEPGIEKSPVVTADEISDVMLSHVLSDLPFRAGDEVALLVNGLGATPLEELYIIARHALKRLSGGRLANRVNGNNLHEKEEGDETHDRTKRTRKSPRQPDQ